MIFYFLKVCVIIFYCSWSSSNWKILVLAKDTHFWYISIDFSKRFGGFKKYFHYFSSQLVHFRKYSSNNSINIIKCMWKMCQVYNFCTKHVNSHHIITYKSKPYIILIILQCVSTFVFNFELYLFQTESYLKFYRSGKWNRYQMF